MRQINPLTDGYEGDRDLDRTPQDDQFAIRKFISDDGREFLVRCKDPYALWYVKPRKGPTPDSLKGTWTTIVDAERAIAIYCNQNPRG